MVVNDSVVSAVKTYTLDFFDSITDMGFSSSITADASSSNTLSGEFIRKVLDSSDKDSGAFTYLFEGVLGLTEGNGNTFNKLGLFTDHAGNTLKINQVLDIGVAKDVTREINCAFELSVDFVDST
jgi:hypothetical protein